MSKFEYLNLVLKDGVATITLDRPEVYNALNDELTYEIQDALKIAKKDETVRVVVLTGNGKAFCSGQDLKSSGGEVSRSFSESIHKRYNPIIRLLRAMPKPVICKLNGVAAGAGCSLALACDYVVASDEATLIEVFVNIGLVLDSGSSYFLPKSLSYNKAFELATMGTKVSASEAEKLGLINKVVPSGELDDAVADIVNYYKNAPTKAIGLIKKMLNRSYTVGLEEMLEYEAYCQEIAGRSEDYKEGVSAFLEKRKPRFTGK